MVVFNFPPGTSCGVSQSFGADYFAFPFCAKTKRAESPRWTVLTEGEMEKGDGEREEERQAEAGLGFHSLLVCLQTLSQSKVSLKGLHSGSSFTHTRPLPPFHFWDAMFYLSGGEIKVRKQGFMLHGEERIDRKCGGIVWKGTRSYASLYEGFLVLINIMSRWPLWISSSERNRIE